MFYRFATGILFFTAVVLLLAVCTSEKDKTLKEAFQDPPLEYRMNRNHHSFPMEPVKQDSFIQAHLDNGWGGFTINVPYAHYLTDSGMKATLHFAEKANAKGMDLWLYDERGYPSGNAGDLVIRENPDWEAKGLFFDDTLVRKGKISFDLPPGDIEFLAAYPVSEGKVDYSRAKDLSGLVSGPVLEWTVPEGQWSIFAVSKYILYDGFQISQKPGSGAGPHYPSLMNPEVTRAFIRITHDTYARYMGEDLGKYFTSTFTDEPSSMAVPFEWYSWSVIPWDETLSGEVETRYGYRPEEKLVELFVDKGPSGQEVRYQYFHTVGDLMAGSYFRPIREWCEAHNLLSGGHMLLEESMLAHVVLYGDIMQCFREMHAPGIDILSCYPKFMPVHSPKLASSAMELTGNERVMSEPCPIHERFTLGHEPPPDKVRGHLNMLMAAGVTDFNNYLRLTEFDQEGKVAINTYVGRVNMLLRGARTRADVGIVYPIESLWTRFAMEPLKVWDGLFRDPDVTGWDTLAGGSQAAVKVEQDFRNASRLMFNKRWEYSYLDARAIIDSRVEGDELVHGELRWKVLLLPSVSTLPAEAWARLKEFMEAGGQVLAIGDLAENSDKQFPDPEAQEIANMISGDGENTAYLPDWTGAAVDAVLNEWMDKAVQLSDESLPLRIAHRQKQGKDIFFVYNDSESTISTSITLQTRDKMEEWDPVTGSIVPVSTEISIKLLPYQGKVYRAL